MRPFSLILCSVLASHGMAQSTVIFTENFETAGAPSLSPQWVWSGNAPTAVPDCDGGWGIRKELPQPGEPNVPEQPVRWLFHPLPHDALVQFNVTVRAAVSEAIPSSPNFVHATICWFKVSTGTPVDWNGNFATSASEFCDPFVGGLPTPALPSDPTAQFGVLIYGQSNTVMTGGYYDLAHVQVETYERRAQFVGTVLLGGAYNAATQRMSATLNQEGLVPLTEPYTALGYPQMGGGGGETTTTTVLNTNYPSGRVVDWVRLELRSAANPAVLVATRQALVLENGQIVSTTGQFGSLFNVLHGNYYVAVRHRSHLGVMTGSSITVPYPGGGVWTYSFANPAFTCYGTAPRTIQGSAALLWPGNALLDDEVKYTGADNDRDAILTAIGGSVPTNVLSGQYRQEDVNLDGVVRYTGLNNDRDIVLQTIGGSTPTTVRVEQVP